MANVDDQVSKNPDELKLPGEESTPSEPAAETTPEPAPEAEAPQDQAEPQDSEQTSEPAETVEEEAEKAPGKMPLYLEWGGAIGIPLIVVALGCFGVLYLSTALYLIAVGFIPYGIWKGRQTNTVYTVVLGCALAAVLTAIYCLWMEVGRYEFDVKARQANPRLGAVVQRVDYLA